ncbi:MAG: C4-type zinc ribbon domain-containing protein [Eubacteriales bacterium]|nr:C4-type zinc ribbon domain-containing protein [Eubacteriales bacterium]
MELLWDYQQADVAADNVKKEIARSPKRLRLLKLRDNIKKQQEFLQTLENEIMAMIDRLDVIGDAVSLNEDQLKQLQEKVQSQPAKDSGAVKAYIKELEKLVKDISSFEAETKKIREEASEREKKQRDIKRLAVRIKLEFDTLREEYNLEYQNNSKELKKLRAVATEKAKLVDSKEMERYNAIKKHSIPPMAKLIDGSRCGGCNMSFPSSVLHDIKSGQYVECETCGRMIIL